MQNHKDPSAWGPYFFHIPGTIKLVLGPPSLVGNEIPDAAPLSRWFNPIPFTRTRLGGAPKWGPGSRHPFTAAQRQPAPPPSVSPVTARGPGPGGRRGGRLSPSAESSAGRVRGPEASKSWAAPLSGCFPLRGAFPKPRGESAGFYPPRGKSGGSGSSNEGSDHRQSLRKRSRRLPPGAPRGVRAAGRGSGGGRPGPAPACRRASRGVLTAGPRSARRRRARGRAGS